MEPSSYGKVPPLQRGDVENEMFKYKLPQKTSHNSSHSYLARVRPMPLSANLGTRADSQHMLSLQSMRLQKEGLFFITRVYMGIEVGVLVRES